MTYKAKLSGANKGSCYVHPLYVLPFNNVTLQAALNRNVKIVLSGIESTWAAFRPKRTSQPGNLSSLCQKRTYEWIVLLKYL